MRFYLFFYSFVFYVTFSYLYLVFVFLCYRIWENEWKIEFHQTKSTKKLCAFSFHGVIFFLQCFLKNLKSLSSWFVLVIILCKYSLYILLYKNIVISFYMWPLSFRITRLCFLIMKNAIILFFEKNR